jgi:hypothetical protein
VCPLDSNIFIGNNNMAYLYKHIRLDKNEPFYVGIGSDNSYKRSNSHKHRNKHWRNIVSKTPYKVEILLDNLTWSEACKKETEFIKLYGRADLGKGTLVNMTDGGEGNNNPSEATRMSISNKIKANKKRGSKISAANKGKTSPNKGRTLTKEHKAKIKAKRSHLKGRKNTWQIKPVLQCDKQGKVIKEWESQAAAQAYFDKPKSDGIGAVCRGEQKTAYGFIWKFK